MRSAFSKEVIRSITHSMGRFLAIAGIVALGTGFYAGLRMTSPDMNLAADIYYDGTALSDVRVLSTLGLTDDDVAALERIEGVEGVMPSRETDVMATINGEQYPIRVHALDASALTSDTSDGVHALSDDEDYLNRPILASGAWPTKPGECVLSADKVTAAPTNIGDTVSITEGTQDVDEVLATRTYTITGFVHASYYVSSTGMGSTTLGSGSIQQIMYVPAGDFSQDMPYTEAFLSVAGARDEFGSSDAYDELVGAVVERIEEAAPARERARADGLRADAQKELDEQRADYERERADAEAQLEDARQQLDEAAATIAQSERQLADGQASYDAGAVELARQRDAAPGQLAAAEAELSARQADLDAARPALEDAQQQLEAGWAQWRQGDAELAGYKQQLAEGEGSLAAMQAKLQEMRNQGLENTPAYQDLKAQADQLAASLPLLQQAIAVMEPQLNDAKSQLDSQQAVFDAQRAAFDEGAAQLAQGWADLDAARTQADSQITAAQAQLDAAAAQLASGRAELAQGRADYEEGLAAYEQKRAEADEQFAEAERKLADAQQQIDDLENPSWYVMDRSKIYGAASFEADAGRVDSIAQVFPFIFFLVAALVALTTMTRMVEEERVLIGTYKALGYRRSRITSKYLIYAGAASGAGSIIGIGVLSQLLPAVIMKAYAIIYFVPSGPLPIDPVIAGLSAGLGVGITLFATWAAAHATLREQPAALMLPRAPKAGKRILLERATPLWRRVSFSWKVTFRNIFRYKKRFIMTLIGIAGCTALLLTGLGLQDAINDIIDKHFGQVVKYNTTVTMEDDLSDESARAVDAVLADRELVSASMRAHRENMLASSPQKSDLGVELIVPEHSDEVGTFVEMRTRQTQEPIAFDGESVVLSEKLGRELGVEVGDTFTLSEQDQIGNATGDSYELTVTGLKENYIYNYVYVGPDLWERVTGERPAYAAVYAICPADSAKRATFGDSLRAIEGVKTVAYNDETIDTYRKMIASVGLIVIVLVVAAAALAFIVLYNLTNINITERQREIATLKVLGFTPREVDAYIFRETILLTVLGCLLGLVLGIFMEGFVVVTAEVDQVMFGRDIHAASFVIAFVLTMLFSVLVALAMRRKLSKIDMVESLKSNE